MVAFKAAQTAAVLTSPPAELEAVLLYGPEPGLVSDRAETLARAMAGEAGEIIRLDDADLATDPGKLAVEARTASLFGGRNVVRIKAGPRLEGAGLADLLGEELACFLIVEAGNLRPSAKLRQTFERATRGAALPCYAEPARDIARLIDQALADGGATMSAGVRSHLVAELAADPGLARQEIGKLLLYAGGDSAITMEHVTAILGDTGQAALEALAEATANRRTAVALKQLDRLLAAGTSAQAAIGALARHFEQLHRVAAAIEAGASAAAAIKALRPPLHFKQQDALAAQVKRWPRRALARAIEALRDSTQASRLKPELERAIAERAILRLAARS